MRTTENIRETYEYLDDEELPALVLGIPIAPDYPEAYTPKPGELVWRKIAHQTAGYACHQRYIFGAILPVSAEVALGMHRLAEWFVEGNISMPASLESVLDYRERLHSNLSKSVDCSCSHHMLEEAIYPIDATAEALSVLTTAQLPKDLDDLIQWESDLEQLCGMISRWHLFVLGENCD